MPQRSPRSSKDELREILGVLQRYQQTVQPETLQVVRGMMATVFTKLTETNSPEDLVPDGVFSCLENGDKIKAIKILREYSGLGLKESKTLVEKIEANFGDKDVWA